MVISKIAGKRDEERIVVGLVGRLPRAPVELVIEFDHRGGHGAEVQPHRGPPQSAAVQVDLAPLPHEREPRLAREELGEQTIKYQ